jgi:MFS family permease
MLAATFGAFVNYAVLLTVVPMWAVSGGAGAAGAGGTTGAFMLVTVLTQLAVPWMLRRAGYRWVLVAGILALGVPAIGYAASTALPVLMAVSVVRGVGFGMVTVAGAGLVPHLLPRWAHGRGAGLYGLAIGTPNLLALPLGVWAAGHIGYRPIFVVLTALPVAGALVAVAMKTNRTPDAPAPRPAGEPDARTGRAGTLRPLVAPWLMLWTAAIIAGGLLTFLPIAVAGTAGGIVPVALLAFSAGAMGSRWGAGVLNDRRGMGRSLPAAVLSGVVGAGGLVAATLTGGGAVTAAVTVAGALAIGLGFGAVQNDTLVIMFASGSGYGLASAVWNTAFDAGTGAAAVGVGLIVQHLGYPVGFGVSGVVALACLPLALRRSSPRIPDRV